MTEKQLALMCELADGMMDHKYSDFMFRDAMAVIQLCKEITPTLERMIEITSNPSTTPRDFQNLLNTMAKDGTII